MTTAAPSNPVFRSVFGWRPLGPFLCMVAMIFTAASVSSRDGLGGFEYGLFGVAVVLGIVAGAMSIWPWLDTKYRIRNGVLLLTMGPFRKRIALDGITSLARADPPFYWVYGLGMRAALRIDYTGGRAYVTPQDEEGFAAAVGVPVRSRSGEGRA